VALALRLGADGLGLLDGRKPKREVRRRRRAVGIVEQRQRDAPKGHAAFRIGLRDILEYFLGLAIPERMLVSHPSIEAALRGLVARRHEMDGAKSLIRFILRECRRSG